MDLLLQCLIERVAVGDVVAGVLVLFGGGFGFGYLIAKYREWDEKRHLSVVLPIGQQSQSFQLMCSHVDIVGGSPPIDLQEVCPFA